MWNLNPELREVALNGVMRPQIYLVEFKLLRVAFFVPTIESSQIYLVEFKHEYSVYIFGHLDASEIYLVEFKL